ncbi:hypothetical protein [Paenibacillus sp. 481]|uniref:hypothetical protein n=1 Tax=Paenibacillus sp. 481 TaxID=2835869 RepID=UPI001E4E534B|nr:hypothetical protein [Paenibacillus sp. 481]UHA74847.1 PD40 domain-containing protein [Paenibacillus sp. 481]
MKLVTSARFIRFTALLTIISLLVWIAACNKSSNESLKVYNPPVHRDAQPVSLFHIERLDNLFCSDWMSYNKLICSTTRAESKSEHMYIRDIRTGEEKPIGIAPYLSVHTSPDGQHLYAYSPNGWEAVLMQLANNLALPLTIQQGSERGAWADDNTYIAPLSGTNDYDIAMINKHNGMVTPIALPQQTDIVRKVQKHQAAIYVLDQSGQFTMYKSTQAEPIHIRADVADFSLSPDGKQLAFVVNNPLTNQQELYMTAPHAASRKGKDAIAKTQVINQLSWSPNGKQLAFMTFSLDPGMTGLYVMEAKTGSSTQVSYQSNVKVPIVWSPDSSRLMVSERNDHGLYNRHSITTVYQLK